MLNELINNKKQKIVIKILNLFKYKSLSKKEILSSFNTRLSSKFNVAKIIINKNNNFLFADRLYLSSTNPKIKIRKEDINKEKNFL